MASHEVVDLAGFNHRKQVTVFGVWGDGAGRRVPTIKRKVLKASRERVDRAGGSSVITQMRPMRVT